MFVNAALCSRTRHVRVWRAFVVFACSVNAVLGIVFCVRTSRTDLNACSAVFGVFGVFGHWKMLVFGVFDQLDETA